MRGPKPVDDVLRELHRNAFQNQNQTASTASCHPPMPVNTRPFYTDSNRVEIISNVSESETNLSELADIAAFSTEATALAVPPSTAAAPARKRRAAGPAKARTAKPS